MGTEPNQMTAPTVQIDSDPTRVKFTWIALTPEFDGGVPVT